MSTEISCAGTYLQDSTGTTATCSVAFQPVNNDLISYEQARELILALVLLWGLVKLIGLLLNLLGVR